MKYARSVLFKALRLLTLVGACTALSSHADDYSDVSGLLRANKYPEALTKVESLLAAKPADPQLRFFKGVIQRNLGKPGEAIVTFTKLTEDHPELPEPYNNLAVLYAGQGDFDKARVALEMAIRTNPSYATAHENIGDVYARLASQAYNKALQLDNSNPAVPPKLALIRELFKPNLASSSPAPAATVVAAAAKSPPIPAPVPASPPITTPAPVAAPAKPAVPITTAAVPAAKPAAVQVDDEAAKGAETAVLAWAKAWANKDMANYLAAYGPEFSPGGQQSRSAWEKDRRDRIMGKSRISVTLNDLSVKVTGDVAVAKFHQAYKADALSIASRKTLNLRNNGKRWLITRESTGN